MKKQLFSLMTILTILSACQKNEVSVSLPEEVTIHATIEEKDATKTIMDESNNILWSENDQIIAFMKSSYGHKYQVKPSFVGKSYADFSMVSSGNGNDLSAGNEWEHNVVYYPYSENIECLKSGANYELEVNLPAEQVYVPDSFANGSMAMVAVSENNNITFKNVLGGIKLHLKGTQKVTSIKIEGKNNEKLAGSAVVMAYTDGTKPTISMSSSASTSVTLNCGQGVQLNESTDTEFIIAVPPVLFSNGFTVTIIDYEGTSTVIETDKVNTVIRASLLTMPSKTLDSADSGDNDITTNTPVEFVKLNQKSLALKTEFTYRLTATIFPADATYKEIAWSTDNPAIVTIDNQGVLHTLSSGVANITVDVAGVIASCTVKVIPLTTKELIDYEEDSVNYGKGIAIGDIVWAPVNCGYKENDYKAGKLYQWGRLYGQGFYDNIEVIEGPVSISNGQKVIYKNTFFSDTQYPYDWASDFNKHLWNQESELNPIKSEYDPCPDGWRIPTSNELSNLVITYNRLSKGKGIEFSGEYTFLDGAPRIILPTTGYRGPNGIAYNTMDSGEYWSSYSDDDGAHNLYFYNAGTPTVLKNSYRTNGKAIRCVQE